MVFFLIFHKKPILIMSTRFQYSSCSLPFLTIRSNFKFQLVLLSLNAFIDMCRFLGQLLRLGVNLKNFPTSVVPATFAILFHLGLAAVLLLYVLFWWKVRLSLYFHFPSFYLWLSISFIIICFFPISLQLDLFTTLKILGLLGVFLLFVGHRLLSHLASASAKLKSA